ncbi:MULTISPECIES: proline--tRNA ligase [Candidatus Nitrosocaldus]|uniref:Proline--tRNA ligase n=1 Tax=Candidatus Nitrosocaldus cavascurensis TaxID=2058097 RepID=A0A2K5AQN8_9ARCH|nr:MULTISPECIES: proline--tRNA ligase [Candidatus Nitrosocaldus]SPC33963.1 Proline--tRNA ligase [Candidatus Nitrosocaldus cavascurensis]
MSELGVTVKKDIEFGEWYIQVVLKSNLLDYAPIKGFIVLKPYGYSIWERIKEIADKRFKETGHQNAFLPTLIPESLLSKEAEHFEGFKPEVFWVTHAGNDELGERLALRPTSETLAYEIFSRWVRSYRDLPLKINFWNTALRAEIKSTKPLIRTSEFLWQEGHTVHASREEAEQEAMLMLSIYKEIMEEYLAIPVIAGYKSEKEKFVGADYTLTLEALMPDGRALQMGTSHNLGQNFSKPFNIKFLDKDDREQYAWQTSWGISWRLIGAVVMVHGDDKGLILPPRIAPIQIVIIPIFYGDESKDAVLAKCRSVYAMLKDRFRVHLDDREEYTPGYKFNDWELKGIPLRLEIGPRDVKQGKVVLVRRDDGKKVSVGDEELLDVITNMLEDVQHSLYARALKFLNDHTFSALSYDEFRNHVEHGFVKAYWCGSQECELRIKEETGADIRVIPFNSHDEGEVSYKQEGRCIYCGKSAVKMAYFARAY